MALIVSYVDGAMKAFGVAWDAWRTTRGGAGAVTARQARRLQALVAHARTHSRFYAEYYRGLPDGRVGLADLPRFPRYTSPN